jgi:hypothetical protein
MIRCHHLAVIGYVDLVNDPAHECLIRLNHASCECLWWEIVTCGDLARRSSSRRS